MNFTAKDVADLRAKTNAGMMDCKKALSECDGNFEKAMVWLREKGIAAAAKKQSRIASEGIVTSYIHMGGKIGVLVEINCETDFVAKTDEFLEIGHDVALQIAAAAPKYVRIEDVPANEVEAEKEILKNQALNEGKPAAIVDKMVEGRVKKFYQDVCLLEQTFVKDPSMTIQQYINEKTLKIGEKISIRRFVRFEMGEGLEKRNENLAEEVEKQMKGNK
ncbi:MAG: translation elongation factor Ts [Clostridia bacterium]|nr:translation elongation factor Ts [Clostridia bacterium]MBQ8792396.1 translation elongation factor Ts [Clostridia bacterium]